MRRYKMARIFETTVAGRVLKADIGRVAEQAGGALLCSYGDTVVLVTATASSEPREGISFFPLSVDFEEKQYSAGKIPGGFIKREGRPTEKAVLTSRLIDRPIRPLFPKGYRNDVQVIATVLSVDQDCDPAIVAMIGSSIALSISDIPFDGPTGSVCIGRVDGEFVVNPNEEQGAVSDMHVVVSGTKEAIMMVEAGAHEVSEETMLDAILLAHEEIKKIIEFVEEITNEVGKEKVTDYIKFETNPEIVEKVKEIAFDDMREAILTFEKQERSANIDKVKADVMERLSEEYPEQEADIKDALEKLVKMHVRSLIVKDGIRPDHRKTDEIRPISCEVGLLPRTHGSGLFTRGQTQALTIATLGALGDAQILDGLGAREIKRYMHHYNFPPYSVGETRFLRGPGRREIGHGALAERALVPVLPAEEEFPYAIRLVSEVLSSNGSSSQASVCGSTLSLLDAGVPIKAPVAGIAMGLIKEDDDVAILSDIQGMEDFLGDMDFKVAGSEKGITAIQMDIKIHGIDKAILTTALEQARLGRIHILNKMLDVISEPREELSQYAPRIIKTKIHPDKIRDVIGPGGKVINKIIADTEVKIDIEDDGTIFITAANLEQGNKAIKIIEDIVAEVEVGKIYDGKVARVTNFGAFVEVLPGKEGLCHISQLDKERTNKVEDLFNVGDPIRVKVTEIDKQGRVNLSRKAVLIEEEKNK